MCFVCSRLGLPEDDEDWASEEDHDDEDEANVTQPQFPRKQTARRSPKQETVVEPAPSHDNRPAFAAYSVLEGTQPADRINQRASYGLCIYDVTPDADPSRARQMARAFYERTKAYRRRPDGDPDRVEVVVFPRPKVDVQSPEADREHAEHCMRHFEKERASRMVMGDAAAARSWYLPELLSNMWYTWGILVISRVTDRWEEGLDWVDKHPEEYSCIMKKADESLFGTCLLVMWLPREEIWRAYEESITPGEPVGVSAYGLENLRSAAQKLLRCGVVPFYEHFLPDGILDLELAAARQGIMRSGSMSRVIERL